MKLEDKIEYLNDNIENEEIKKEALFLKQKLHKKGNIFFLVGLIGNIISFIVLVTISIIFIIKKELSLYNLIPLFLILPFSILTIVGVFYKNLSQSINE